jgi:hypothetical protein
MGAEERRDRGGVQDAGGLAGLSAATSVFFFLLTVITALLPALRVKY